MTNQPGNGYYSFIAGAAVAISIAVCSAGPLGLTWRNDGRNDSMPTHAERREATVSNVNELFDTREKVLVMQSRANTLEQELAIKPLYTACRGQTTTPPDSVKRVYEHIARQGGAAALIGKTVYFQRANALCATLYAAKEQQ